MNKNIIIIHKDAIGKTKLDVSPKNDTQREKGREKGEATFLFLHVKKR